MLSLLWSGSGSTTVQGKVTSLVPHQNTRPSWKQNHEWRTANHENHHDDGPNLRQSTKNNVRRMQHDKDLDEADEVDPDAITNAPSVSLTPSATPSERPTAKPTKTPTRAPTASPTRSPTATPSVIPSSSPSATPSTTPTSSPSATPSQSPSARPSLSFKPTIESSETPSMSLSPSMSPTGTPSSGPTIDCTSDETGSFGVTNITNDLTNETTSITVNYYYELETSIVDPQVIQTVILPAIEIAISDLIIALLFNDRSDECAARLETDVNLRKRQLQQQQQRRKLEVVGVSGSPPDVIYEDGECQIGGQDLLGPSSSSDNTTTTTNNSSTNIFQCLTKACSVVEGELTLFVKTENVKGDEEERVKTLIREGMEQGDFVAAHANLCQLYYIDNFEDQYVKVEDDNEGGFVNDLVDQFGVVPLAIVAAAIAMVCFLCIVLCLCLRRRKNEDDDDDDCNDDESMSSSSFTDHPSSIVTTTSSLLNNDVTPPPTQPTSTSLNIHKDEDGYGSA
eukprot:CAMPEP_0198284982 /NCGR_PEP_ID=MMETSP1449-20131203/4320_1 /TAXON_ID=420275 /ORGANISM="Attheya septentrionalis, Strain CCMP2084" /LENGTH=508 /DNA_ID=CAMNT_0043982207 /DNA_START=313 /DNA_END=1842 /DNA_ORIENTATION=+